MLGTQAMHRINHCRIWTLRQAEHGTLNGTGAGNLGVESINEKQRVGVDRLAHGEAPVLMNLNHCSGHTLRQSTTGLIFSPT
jgi:hypothetical protein